MYKKYIKYKNKYLNLKQIKGGNKLLEGWSDIPNTGRQNCGIFINLKEKDKIMKCSGTIANINAVNNINDKIHLFPIIYSVDQLDLNYYTIMEKLDGDISDIFYKFIPNNIINKLDLEKDIKYDIMQLFKLKINGQKKFFYIENIKENSILEEFKNSKVSLKLFDTVIEKIIYTIKNNYQNIIEGMFDLKFKLYTLGYTYTDNKFDNFGYKFADEGIKILDKKFIFYFLDYDSGLGEFNNNEDKSNYIKTILYELNNKYITYGINGGYNLTTFLDSYIHFGIKSYSPIVYNLPIDNFLDIPDDIYKILIKKYNIYL
jgi:hypothetical protein